MRFTRCKYFLVFVFCCCLSQHLFAQITWTVYDTSNSGIPHNIVYDIAEDSSGNLWVATDAGIGKFDGTNWTVYDEFNSPLPDNYCEAIATEADTIWVGTINGLAKFDGANWTIYNNIYITDILIDVNGNEWVASAQHGVGKYDGTSWTTYDTINSGLPNDYVYSIAEDDSGNIWFGTDDYPEGGLAKFDGSNWTIYDTSNSGLPDNNVGDVSIDPLTHHVWASTGAGLAEFDGANWTVYDTSNSDIPSPLISTEVMVDATGNKFVGAGGMNLAILHNDLTWTIYNPSNSPINGTVFKIFFSGNSRWIGTAAGLIKMDGYVGIAEYEKGNEFVNVYPNPFTDNLKISSTEKVQAIEIFQVDGKRIYMKDFISPAVLNDYIIALSELNNGLYFIKINAPSKEVFKRIIKTS